VSVIWKSGVGVEVLSRLPMFRYPNPSYSYSLNSANLNYSDSSVGIPFAPVLPFSLPIFHPHLTLHVVHRGLHLRTRRRLLRYCYFSKLWEQFLLDASRCRTRSVGFV
jgi:hypothetical protein